MTAPTESLDVVVIGGGQAGLAMGYQLAKQGRRFVILDASPAVGEAWRTRWDSLHLITPCPYNSLPGLEFPAPAWSFPHKDKVVTYLQDYASKFRLPIRHNQKVTRLSPSGEGYSIETSDLHVTTRAVVVATGAFQHPVRPAFAEAASELHQLHSVEYRNPAQIAGKRVLVVGCGNSGAGIAQDLARTHRVTLSLGRTASTPRSILGRDLFWWAHLLGVPRITANSALGKRMRAGPDSIIGTTPAKLVSEHGITLAARVVGIEGTQIRFADGARSVFDAVIWATGFRPRYDWLELPVMDGTGRPQHLRGETRARGVYFLGLKWQHAVDSSLLGGLSRDSAFLADRITDQLAGRGNTTVRPS